MSSETPHATEPEDQANPSPHSPRRSDTHVTATGIFVGAQGLRAGWGCLLFLVFLVLFAKAASLLVHLLSRQGPHTHTAAMPPGLTIAGELVSFAGVLLVTFVMARIERRPFLSFGLGAGRGGSPAFSAVRFTVGLVAGFAAISALVGILYAGGLLSLASAHLPALSALRYALAWALAFLCVAFFEESLLRGYLLFTLQRGTTFWPAAVILSAMFGFIHHSNPGESPVGLFAAAAVGLFFCLTIWYTGSLWWAIGFHAAWDWGESFFWGTSDSGLHVQGHLFNESARGPLLWSGGATGPEGSLWVLAVVAVCALLAWAWWRRAGAAPQFRRLPE